MTGDLHTDPRHEESKVEPDPDWGHELRQQRRLDAADEAATKQANKVIQAAKASAMDTANLGA